MFFRIVLNDFYELIVLCSMAAEANPSLDMPVLREPTGTSTSATWSVIDFYKIPIFQSIDRYLVFSMISAMAAFAECHKL